MHVYNDTKKARQKKKKKKLKQPHVRKQQKHSQEKQQPHTPAHARPLGHEQHPVHSSAQADARAVERFVHGFGLLFVSVSDVVCWWAGGGGGGCSRDWKMNGFRRRWLLSAVILLDTRGFVKKMGSTKGKIPLLEL
jgi:hypothetical protein